VHYTACIGSVVLNTTIPRKKNVQIVGFCRLWRQKKKEVEGRKEEFREICKAISRKEISS